MSVFESDSFEEVAKGMLLKIGHSEWINVGLIWKYKRREDYYTVFVGNAEHQIKDQGSVDKLDTLLNFKPDEVPPGSDFTIKF